MEQKEIRPLKRWNESKQEYEEYYPATTAEAVADRNKRQSVQKTLDELDDALKNVATTADKIKTSDGGNVQEKLFKLASEVKCLVNGNIYDETVESNNRIVQFYRNYKAGEIVYVVILDDMNLNSKGSLYGYRADGSYKQLLLFPQIRVGDEYSMELEEDYEYLHFYNSGGELKYIMRLYVKSGEQDIEDRVSISESAIQQIDKELYGVRPIIDEQTVELRGKTIYDLGITTLRIPLEKDVEVDVSIVSASIGDKRINIYGWSDNWELLGYTSEIPSSVNVTLAKSYSILRIITSDEDGFFDADVVLRKTEDCEQGGLTGKVKDLDMLINGDKVYDQIIKADNHKAVFEGFEIKSGGIVNVCLEDDCNKESKGTLYGFRTDGTYDILKAFSKIEKHKLYSMEIADDYDYLQFWHSGGADRFSMRIYMGMKGLADNFEALRKRYGKIVVLDKNGNGDYSDFTDAYLNAGDTKEQPVTILVMPGEYITETHISNNIATDTYGWHRYVSIIGVDKNSCIIKSKNGAYQSYPDGKGQDDGAPIKIGGTSYIANLTIICTDENTQYQGPDELRFRRAYCLHLDAAVEEGDVLEVHNCNLINDHWSCVGIGFAKNYVIKLTDCDLFFNPSGKDTPSWIGAIFAHSNSQKDGGLLSVRNCKIHAEGQPAVWLTRSNEHIFEYEFVNNAIVEGGDSEKNIENGLVKGKFSNGNTIACLNNTNPSECFLCEYGITTYKEITQALIDNKIPILKVIQQENTCNAVYGGKWSDDKYYFNTIVSTNPKYLYSYQVAPDDTWKTVSVGVVSTGQLSNGDVTKLTKDTIGDERTPIYLNKGVPTACNKDHILIMEDDVVVETDDTKGVAPYSTSYGYTNITIINDKIKPSEHSLYSFIVNEKMVASASHRNVRVRFGYNGAWHPVMGYGTSVLSGNTYFVKAMTCLFMYKSDIIDGGAFHMLYDANTTYPYLSNIVQAGSLTVDDNGFAAKYSLQFHTKPITSIDDRYSSMFTASSTSVAKKIVNVSKLYLDRLPLCNNSADVGAGKTSGNSWYQKYAGLDIRYTANTNSTYVSAYRKVFMYLHNFNPTDMSFEPDATVGNIMSADKISLRFPNTMTGEVYLWFMGWSNGTWQTLSPNFSQIHQIYKYNPQLGTLANTDLII